MASSELARGGKDVGFVKVFALKQQRRLGILRHCIREAVAEVELRRLDEAVPLRDRLRQLQQRVLSRPATGLEADKAFYDELSGNA